MARRTEARVVLVTCGSSAEGRKIANAVVKKRLAACVNMISAPVQSVYRWKGKVESAKEFLLIIKTTSQRVKELQREIAYLHSYDTPEFLALVAEGSENYLAWLIHETRR
ncbi:MAG TPA: divalent-cation tolerance protein CutA [Candidatus Acidoferrum sp.]